ncbi:hypothetical protein [Tautonia plasticadhaerens]|uniref:Uncharacterized protein n=1 Tax=Tautonia plasticadhaerens TaxID=2527974 RepID=A0A518H452_9BACT|nr:hypothetical protein [Tautonia plasticadhaerens]QDV35603.1 hypothetical protein ElP_35070 [Tautonia plasticadhaerens]
MGDFRAEHEGRTSSWGLARKALVLTVFAVAMFMSGRLWSLREVREAQRAAGQAEEQRLALQAELVECRNALLLRRGRGEASSGDDPGEDRVVAEAQDP